MMVLIGKDSLIASLKSRRREGLKLLKLPRIKSIIDWDGHLRKPSKSILNLVGYIYNSELY